MKTPRPTIYLYVTTPRLKRALMRLLRKRGFDPVVLKDHRGVDPVRNVILLETGRDVSHLCQVVSYFYLTYKTEATLSVLAFAPKKTLKRNPKLALWEVEGHAALSQVFPHRKGRLRKKERKQLLRCLSGFMLRRPSYLKALDKNGSRPNDAVRDSHSNGFTMPETLLTLLRMDGPQKNGKKKAALNGKRAKVKAVTGHRRRRTDIMKKK